MIFYLNVNIIKNRSKGGAVSSIGYKNNQPKIN